MHFLRSCTLFVFLSAGAFSQDVAAPVGSGYSQPAPPQVAPGQVLTFAFGLGQTSPAAMTGVAAQPGYSPDSPLISVSFVAFGNVLASAPRHSYSPMQNEVFASIAGAALESGKVGVYQLNVIIPSSLELPVACGPEIRSNVVMNVITSQGVEGVPLCVQP